MSLFDGQPDQQPERKKVARKAICDEAMVSNYGQETRSYNRSTAAENMRQERRRITEKYERGEMTFDPLELLCYCGGLFSTGYQWITELGVGHPIHTEEMEQFQCQINPRFSRTKKNGKNTGAECQNLSKTTNDHIERSLSISNRKRISKRSKVSSISKSRKTRKASGIQHRS